MGLPTDKPRRARVRAAAGGTPPNLARGEHSLVLGGVTYALRLSHTAIAAIEDQCDGGLIPLWGLAQRAALTTQQVGVIIAEFVRAAAAPGSLNATVSADRMAELAYAEGLLGIQIRLQVVLLDAITGGRDAEGNAKAVATPTTH